MPIWANLDSIIFDPKIKRDFIFVLYYACILHEENKAYFRTIKIDCVVTLFPGGTTWKETSGLFHSKNERNNKKLYSDVKIINILLKNIYILRKEGYC